MVYTVFFHHKIADILITDYLDENPGDFGHIRLQLFG